MDKKKSEQAIRDHQEEICSEIYRHKPGSPRHTILNYLYDQTVEQLKGYSEGDDAPCNDVDCDLFQFYSDLHKDKFGFRPRVMPTWGEARAWVNDNTTPGSWCPILMYAEPVTETVHLVGTSSSNGGLVIPQETT